MVDEEDDLPDYSEMSEAELNQELLDTFDRIYSDTLRWETGGRDDFWANLDNLDEDQKIQMLEFADDSIEDLADYQEEDAPDWLKEMGWYDDDGDWHNPFWYH